MARGTAPVKARLLDQEAIAGIGNLLADQALWLARINPARSVDELTRRDVDRLLSRRTPDRSTRAVDGGGVHTLSLIAFRRPGGAVPALRRADGARHGRRPDHLVVLARAGVKSE